MIGDTMEEIRDALGIQNVALEGLWCHSILVVLHLTIQCLLLLPGLLWRGRALLQCIPKDWLATAQIMNRDKLERASLNVPLCQAGCDGLISGKFGVAPAEFEVSITKATHFQTGFLQECFAQLLPSKNLWIVIGVILHLCLVFQFHLHLTHCVSCPWIQTGAGSGFWWQDNWWFWLLHSLCTRSVGHPLERLKRIWRCVLTIHLHTAGHLLQQLLPLLCICVVTKVSKRKEDCNGIWLLTLASVIQASRQNFHQPSKRHSHARVIHLCGAPFIWVTEKRHVTFLPVASENPKMIELDLTG